MENKTALITGGTSGVGLSLVRELAKSNYDVFFIGTNKEKGKEIELALNAKNTTKSTFIPLDLSNLKSVKKFAEDFKNKTQKLDLLGNVAGVFLLKQEITNENLDKTFAIGYLSAFILSTVLEPILENAENARIVNVAGDAEHVLKPSLDFNNLNFTNNFSGFKTTIATVHAKTVLTEYLAKKYQSKNITVNSFHPGLVRGNMGRSLPFPLKVLFKIAKPFMSETSKNGIYVCLSEKLNNVNGKLIIDKKIREIDFEESYIDSLVAKSNEILNLIQ